MNDARPAGESGITAAAAPRRLGFTLLLLFLAACRPEAAEPPREAPPTAVRTVPLAASGGSALRLPGVLRSQRETPLAFRLTGEVVSREVAAGTAVAADAVLFRMDEREFRRGLDAAEANRVGARAQAENAAREAARREELVRRGVYAVETTERATTEARAAAQRLRAAEAEAGRAALTLAHATLTAPAAGIVTEVLAETGQVVTAGQPVAVLAHAAPREAEVFVPEGRLPNLPATALVHLYGEATPRAARLREVAAAADPASRAYRARFTIEGLAPDTPVGSSLTLLLTTPAGDLSRVPASAVAESGSGPFLWRVAEGRVTAERVRLVRLEGEDALVASALPPGTPVVALGVHRLTDGSPVRVIP